MTGPGRPARVIVTRPQREAQAWAQALAQQNIAALALPLIVIRALDDPGVLADAWQAWPQCNAVMFVSTPAVEHFFAARPPGGIDGSACAPGPRCWGPGPGTVAALLRHGVAPARIDAPAPDGGRFDSEALWQRVAALVRPGWQVLVVRGAQQEVPVPHEAAAPPQDSDAPGAAASLPAQGQGQGQGQREGHGRQWLAEQLRAAGAQVRFVAAYRRGPPSADDVQRALAQHRVDAHDLWLFTSAQAIDHLRACLPLQSWSRMRALATHPRIVRAARVAGFGAVHESRPTFDDVVASIKSLR